MTIETTTFRFSSRKTSEHGKHLCCRIVYGTLIALDNDLMSNRPTLVALDNDLMSNRPSCCLNQCCARSRGQVFLCQEKLIWNQYISVILRIHKVIALKKTNPQFISNIFLWNLDGLLHTVELFCLRKMVPRPIKYNNRDLGQVSQWLNNEGNGYMQMKLCGYMVSDRVLLLCHPLGNEAIWTAWITEYLSCGLSGLPGLGAIIQNKY